MAHRAIHGPSNERSAYSVFLAIRLPWELDLPGFWSQKSTVVFGWLGRLFH